MKLPITARQAQYLNNLKMAAEYYRKSCKEVSDQALADIEKLNKGFNYTGPSHQRIFELQVNHGRLNALLEQTFVVFDFSHLNTEDRTESNANVRGWVALACGSESESFDLYFQPIDE